MGDPLSTVASIASLLSLGLQSIEYLHKYYSRYRGQDEDLARIADHLGGLLLSIRTVKELVRTRKWLPDEQKILHNIGRSITSCEDVIRELQDEANKFKKESLNNWKKRVVTAGRQATYPFRRSTIEKLSEDVDDLRDNLSFALQAFQLNNCQNTKNILEDLTAVVKQCQAQNISANVRHWLAAPDATVDFNIASQKRHSTTGQWFTKGSSYTNWLQ